MAISRWNFTLPFVIAKEVGWWNPPLMLLIALAFFGLDQVGAMLEQPFGVEAADISLLSIGAEVADDLDHMLRAAEAMVRREAVTRPIAISKKKTMAHAKTGVEFRTRTTMQAMEDDDDDAGDNDAGDNDAGGDGGGGDGGDDGGDF